jgi:U4/U6.U5 tri-snRNP-associated protein 3
MNLDVDPEDEEAQMAALMGFKSFDTTKQKKVRGNDVGAIAKNKTAQYRQYM